MQKQEKLSIGLDLGTSSVKGVLLSSTSEIIADATAKFVYEETSLTDGSKYIGIDVIRFYDTICGVIRKLVLQSPKDSLITGISMVSASGNTLLCDKSGNPLIKAYSWTNEPMADEVKTVFGSIYSEKVAQVSGWKFSNTFPLAHLSHLRVHEPKLLTQAAHICMTTEYVLFKLTGKWGIDRSTATPSYLYNQISGKWHKPYLDALTISQEKLPKIYKSGELLGTINQAAANDTGLNSGTKVFLGSFDHPGAARANGIKEEGELLLSCGTSWVCFFPYKNRGKILLEKFLCDPFLMPEGPWGAIFSLPKIAAKINYLISKYISKAEDKFEKFDNFAMLAKPGAGGLKINPMSDFENNFSAYSLENVARATMEGTAYALKERLDMFAKSGIKFKSAVMAGGPSQSKVWRKILSEILNIPITVKYGAYSGAVGAAKFSNDV